MILIFLKIDRNENIDILTIKKVNYLLYEKKSFLLNFYNVFNEFMENRNTNIEILIGNRRLSNKEVKVINLMDIDTVIKSLKYEKGTLITEYISLIINDISLDMQNDFFINVQSILDLLFEDERDF